MIRTLYVNLPVSYAERDPGLVDLFVRRGLNAELGLDAVALDGISPRRHVRLAARLRDAGLRVAAHLPFLDLRPGGGDPLVLAAARRRLALGVELAMEYGAGHMVGHAAYHEHMDGYRRQAWLEASEATWAGLLNDHPGHPPLRLENTYEQSPAPLAELLARLPVEAAGACLDVGHWFSFGGGRTLDDLDRWLDALGPRLAHLHLHDNDGDRDAHLGLGRGSIPLARLFAALEVRGFRPTATLEPHSVEDLDASALYMREHPQWFAGGEAS